MSTENAEVKTPGFWSKHKLTISLVAIVTIASFTVCKVSHCEKN